MAALLRAFEPRVVAQARVAAKAARAAAEAGRALEALNAELREATRMEVGNDYADWHPDGLGDVFVALAARIAAGAEGVADDAASIAAGTAALAENEYSLRRWCLL